MSGTPTFAVQTIALDLPPLVAAFGRRLQAAGVPVTVERDVNFARALTLVAPISRRRLYHTARAVLLSDPTQVAAFDAVFAAVFGGPSPGAAAAPRELPQRLAQLRGDQPQAAAGRPPMLAREPGAFSPTFAAPARKQAGEPAEELPVPVLASDEELLRSRRFEELSAAELVVLYRLMSRLRLAPPTRRTRRTRRDRHGERIDLRRTLRGSLRTGGDPIRLARKRRRIVARRLVLLCDISGSMEPYARAYLQFLACAAGAGPQAEAFVFATRITRLTRALRSQNPERALERAAAAAPDWSSGTRIGDALKTFNDRHGRRGMARGAVVVILSDGWERADPQLVAREMKRLERLAYRIVWVNPRVGASGFAPRAGGMVAALPYCDALVSGHTLDALADVIDVIGAQRGSLAPASKPQTPALEPEPEPWASATPLPGSSVAMPSGYGPSRGNTTPGW